MTSTSSANHLLGGRRMEPAAFWLVLLAGSVLIHLLLLLVTRSLLSQVSTQSSPAPISIKFVDASAAPIQQVPARRTTSAAAPLTARSSAPTTPAPSTSTATIAPGSITPQTPRQSASPRPINPEPPQRVPPQRVPPVAPPPRPPRSENIPPSGSDSGAPPFPNTPPGSPPFPGDANPDDRPPSTPPSGTVPPSGNDGGDNGQPPLPSVPIPSVPDQGSGVELSVVNVAPGNLTSTDVGPVPQVRSIPRLFESVTYPAAVRANLGRPVTLQIVIDGAGKPTQIDVVPEETAPKEYSDFVRELLQGSNLEFSPPTQDGKPVRLGAVRLTLRLEPLR